MGLCSCNCTHPLRPTPYTPLQERTFHTNYLLKHVTAGGHLMDLSVLFDGRETNHRIIVGEWRPAACARVPVYAHAARQAQGDMCVYMRCIAQGSAQDCAVRDKLSRSVQYTGHTPAFVCIVHSDLPSAQVPKRALLAARRAGREYYEPFGLTPEAACEAAIALLLRAKVGGGWVRRPGGGLNILGELRKEYTRRTVRTGVRVLV